MPNLRQATAAVNGFEFQKYAGIYLMLKVFDSFKTLKIEGESQDIEIEKDDGLYLFIQAKSTEKPYGLSGSSAKKRFKEAVESFKDTKTSNEGDNLVYINNFEQKKPFGVEWPQFSNPYYFKYEELPELLKAKIRKISEPTSIDLNKLIFAGLTFYGDDPDTKTKHIHEKLKETLAEIDPNLLPHSKLIMQAWASRFGLNGTTKSNKITKESIASDLTFYVLRGAEVSNEYREKLNIAEEDYLEAIDVYGELIERKGLGFKEYNLISKGYQNARALSGKNTIANYITDELKNIINILGINESAIPKNIKETIAKIIAFKIITRNTQLRDINNKLRSTK